MSCDDNGDVALHCKIGPEESRQIGTFNMSVPRMQKLRHKQRSYSYEVALFACTHTVHHKWTSCVLNSVRLIVRANVHPRTGQEGSQGEKGYRYTLSLTSALDWGCRWSALRSGRLTSDKDPVPVVEKAGCFPSAGLDICGESRHPHWDSIPGPSSPQRVAMPTTVVTEMNRNEQKFKSNGFLLSSNCLPDMRLLD